MWRNWNPRTPLVGTYKGAATLESSLAVPQKVKQLPSDPATVPLGKQSEEQKTHSHKTWYMTVPSNIIRNSKEQKQPKCPSTDEWINEIRHMHKTECESATKSSEVLTHATTWITSKTSRSVREVSHRRQRSVWCDLYETSRTGKSRETEGRLAVV